MQKEGGEWTGIIREDSIAAYAEGSIRGVEICKRRRMI